MHLAAVGRGLGWVGLGWLCNLQPDPCETSGNCVEPSKTPFTACHTSCHRVWTPLPFNVISCRCDFPGSVRPAYLVYIQLHPSRPTSPIAYKYSGSTLACPLLQQRKVRTAFFQSSPASTASDFPWPLSHVKTKSNKSTPSVLYAPRHFVNMTRAWTRGPSRQHGSRPADGIQDERGASSNTLPSVTDISFSLSTAASTPSTCSPRLAKLLSRFPAAILSSCVIVLRSSSPGYRLKLMTASFPCASARCQDGPALIGPTYPAI